MTLLLSVLADGTDGKSGLNGLVKNPIGAVSFKKTDSDAALQKAADAWAKAYCDYAKDALAGISTPTNLPTADLLSAQFANAMKAGLAPGAPQGFLDQLPTILAMYWFAMPEPVSFLGVNSGPVMTANAGEAPLTAIIGKVKIAGMAGKNGMPDLITGIDAFTKAVIVALVTPAAVTIQTPLL